MQKKCTTCQEVKLLEQFASKPNGAQGVSSQCKACKQARDKRCYDVDSSRFVANAANARAKKMGLNIALLTREQAKKVLEGDQCYYCALPRTHSNHPAHRPLGFSLDHKTPFSRGGDNADSNLCLACEPCNRAKHDMTAPEFIDFLIGMFDRAEYRRIEAVRVWKEPSRAGG